jgi:hypothetical protein
MEWIVSLLLQHLFYCDHNEKMRKEKRDNALHKSDVTYRYTDATMKDTLYITIHCVTLRQMHSSFL